MKGDAKYKWYFPGCETINVACFMVFMMIMMMMMYRQTYFNAKCIIMDFEGFTNLITLISITVCTITKKCIFLDHSPES